mgnify:CR=1 FL=1
MEGTNGKFKHPFFVSKGVNVLNGSGEKLKFSSSTAILNWATTSSFWADNLLTVGVAKNPSKVFSLRMVDRTPDG